ncbi:MAG: RagB/SusD family nutrient uptake outer membrane protein, partial [Saprospiraceae bacterium]
MKKSTIKSFAFICTLWISISGCESFLDVTPKGLDVLKTTDQFNGIFNNANLFSYLNVRNQPGGISSLLGSAEMPLFMGDDVFSSAGFLNAIPTIAWQNGFKWEANPYLPTDESNEWGAFYNQLYNYNLVAAGVMSSEGGSEDKKKELLAEAKACRAFNHFLVANLFGQPYNVNTATTDLSVPIVVNADVNASDFKRATVKELYDFVINELTQAIPDLQPKVYSRVRMSRPAAQYMLGMVYFQMGNYATALTFLNDAKAGLTGGPLPVKLYNYNTTMTAAAPTGWFTAAQPWRGASGYPLLYNSDENIFLRQLSVNSTINRNCLFIKPAILAL